MTNSNYSVDILINDKPIRKFPHNDKVFIEARKGQEYSVRIKNNSSSRILAVTSVDGLDVLTGKTADADSSGYVINGYNSLTIEGFRISDEKVAKFIFDSKHGSYAASKGTGAEKNVGVIGFKVFEEKQTPIQSFIHNHYHTNPAPWGTPVNPSPWNPYRCNPPIIWCNQTLSTSMEDSGVSGRDTTHSDLKSRCDTNHSTFNCNLGDPVQGKGLNGNIHSANFMSNASPLRGFDTGTSWGNSTESKVVEVTFEKGLLTFSTDIFYASRDSLIEMGVPVTNEKQVSFPNSFADSKYAQPPKGWKG
jgi:hypothetical protein